MSRKIEKPWIVLIALSCVAMSSLGLIINVGGVFLTPISQDLNILRGSISMHATLTQIGSAFMGLTVPKLMEKFELKPLLFVGITLGAGSTILLGLSNQLWQFNLLGLIRGFGVGLLALVPITMILNNWFIKSYGLANSIVMTAPGIVGIIFSPIFSAIIERFSWRFAYIALGILMIVLMIFPLSYPFSYSPEEEGITAYGHEEFEEEETELDRNVITKEMQRKNTRTSAVVFFLIMGFFISGITSFIQHLPGVVDSLGYSVIIGGTVLSAAMVGNSVFKPILGILIDKTNALKASLGMLTVSTLAVVLLLLVQSELGLILSGFLMGSIYSVSTVGITTMTKYFFGIHNFGRIYPVVSFFKSLGVALFLSIYGYVYDISGSFAPNLGIIIFLIVFSVVAMVYNQIHKVEYN